MAQSTLYVMRRDKTGKSVARKIRREGAIPAVLYGRETKSIPLTVNPLDLKKALSTDAGENTLLEIHIKGDGEEITKIALLRDVQYDYLKSRPIHFDFQEVMMKELITVKVPIRIVGKAQGIQEGGILEEIMREIEVECLPASIPNVIDVDVTQLGIGDSLHISDLVLPENITVLQEPEQTIVTILSPVMEEVKPAAPAEPVLAAETGEEEAKAETEKEGDEE
ncbi:MAG: 50S ribosomal protein L25/general stress protein Ctc [Candidatus Dadabacteria bacterium]|nr:50S ribosomal protein L25/general stress protein Ctc [Candidatus Dadabacteria bacterium]